MIKVVFGVAALAAFLAFGPETRADSTLTVEHVDVEIADPTD